MNTQEVIGLSSPRLTRHRQAILETVAEKPMHLTAAEVYDVVRGRDSGIAYATVYNALHYLVSAGLIAEVRRPDGVVSYDRDTAPHDHALCRACGAIADVHRTPETAPGVGAYDEVSTQTGFVIEGRRIEFVGLCPRCQDRDGVARRG